MSPKSMKHLKKLSPAVLGKNMPRGPLLSNDCFGAAAMSTTGLRLLPSHRLHSPRPVIQESDLT